MPSVPKPKKLKKKKVKKPRQGQEPWICPKCPRGNERKFPQKTIADKRAILDHIWGDRVFERDRGACQKSGKKNALSPHHIFPKGTYPAVRWEVEIGILLSYAEHIHFAHGRPYLFELFIRGKKGNEWWEYWHKKAQEKSQFRACDFETIKTKLEKEKECTQPPVI